MTRAGSNGPALARLVTAWLLDSIDDRRRVWTDKGMFTLRVGNPLERWRADTLLTKEPETIEWLNRTLMADSVFYDVGANIGIYTLYACHLFPQTMRAVCFEPEGLNFARLSRNIFDNGLSERVLAIPVALGDSVALIEFRLSSVQAGRALHGGNIAVEKGRHRQGSLVMSLDEIRRLNSRLPSPTHIKIDVDGPEWAVLQGAKETLRMPELRHLLVELTDKEAEAIRSSLDEYGFREIARGLTAGNTTNHIFEKI